MVTSKSLFHSNVVFLYKPENFLMPENQIFAALYSADLAVGAQFVDDPVLKVKMLSLPALGLKIFVEPKKLRVEDQIAVEPEKSELIKQAMQIQQTLFPRQPLFGYGFNFDVNFRFSQVLPMQNWFEDFFGKTPSKNFDLRDFGFQFTLDNQKEKFADQWFFKITSPLELAAHLNRHFNAEHLPKEEILAESFKKCYNEMDKVAESLKI